MSRCHEPGFGWTAAESAGHCDLCGTPSRLDSRVKTELVQRFVSGVPVYRQRFSLVVGGHATGRFYRLNRTAMAHAKQLRGPFEGSLDRPPSTGAPPRSRPRKPVMSGSPLNLGTAAIILFN